MAAASGLRVLTPAGTPARRRGARQACGEGASPAGGTLRDEQTPGRRWTDGRLAAKTVPKTQTRHEENKTVRARRARPLPRTRGHAQCTPRSRSLATHSRVRPATGTRTHTRSHVLTRGVPRGRCGCGSSTRRYMTKHPRVGNAPADGIPAFNGARASFWGPVYAAVHRMCYFWTKMFSYNIEFYHVSLVFFSLGKIPTRIVRPTGNRILEHACEYLPPPTARGRGVPGTLGAGSSPLAHQRQRHGSHRPAEGEENGISLPLKFYLLREH